MVAEKLSEYIISKGISVYAFENAIGASRGSIAKAIKDNKNIGSNVLENILHIYSDINPDWLLTGQGSMLRGSQPSEVSKKINATASPIQESIIYKLYKEKDAEVGQLKEEIGALKLKLSQYISDEEQDHPKGLGTAKNASTKKSSSPNADNVTSANAQ